MRKLIRAAFLLLVIPALASAQDADHPFGASRGQGYVFFGLGTGVPGTPLFEHVGGGGEGFLYKGLGLGGEVEYAHAGGRQEFSRALVGSVDLSYHFGRFAAQGKVEPFVLGGLSAVGPTPNGTGRGSPGGNFGGGANLWVAQHAALRFEFRDIITNSNFWPYDHVVSFRIGVTFR